MDITFDDVAHVIQDAKYQRAILDTAPRPSKRIPPLGRGFNAEAFIEKYEISCATVIAEPLGRWFMDKFADLNEKITEEVTGQSRGERHETRFLSFVESVYEAKRQDPSGVAPFGQVLQLLREHRLDRHPLVESFLLESSSHQKPLRKTLETAMTEAVSAPSAKDGEEDVEEEEEEDSMSMTEENAWVAYAQRAANGTAEADDEALDENDVGLVTKEGEEAGADADNADDEDNPAELKGVPSLLNSESGFLDGIDAETEVATYDPNNTAAGGVTTQVGTSRVRTVGAVGRLTAARAGVKSRLHKQRSVDLSEALDSLMLSLCQPIYERFVNHKVGFTHYARFKTYAMQPVAERQIEYHRVLGQGAFGTVHGCAILQTGTLLAMKLMSKKKIKVKHSKSQVIAERTALETLARHPSPYCMKLRYAFQTKDAYNLILPLAIGGDLKFHLRMGPFSEKRAKFYAAEIAVGVGHMHSLGFIMRDLKPRNILLDSDGHVKISDFGLAVPVVGGNLAKGRAGTEGYWSPEVINNHRYGVDADWWSYGTCLFELLTGFNPFSTKHTGLPTRNQGTRTATVKFPKTVPQSARALISALLDRNVETRLGTKRGVNDVLNARAFPFWNGLDMRRIRAGTHPVPWVPEKGQIYAVSQSEMLDFEDDPNGNTLRRVKLTPEDAIDFEDFVDLDEHQKDIVRALPINTDVVHFVEDLVRIPAKTSRRGPGAVGASMASAARKSLRPSTVEALGKNDACCSLM
ncbi:Protein kinase, putative [Hondaea fermentalgiana]|uniref:Protein kinase, putative n=1 Tax=Hondaea fermentalgiana TaxID=2315210 RepID=A0A2R5GY83_9STRA|nr:Protein kinase, putative [Hondaea fermentalgiana]|eukprot:GBG33411.1 Protein kinase, putative [Hondaea fermentalgiana]